jgi:hypothetical protein
VRTFRMYLLLISTVLLMGQSAPPIENFGPDYALRNVLVDDLSAGDVSRAARKEISARLIGYWRQVLEELPALTEAEERRAIDKVHDLRGEQLDKYFGSTEYTVAFMHEFTRTCITRASTLNEHVACSDATEPFHWLRMMGCYADNPGVFFRFSALGMAGGHPVNAMRHFDPLARYVSGPLADALQREANPKTGQ